MNVAEGLVKETGTHGTICLHNSGYPWGIAMIRRKLARTSYCAVIGGKPSQFLRRLRNEAFLKVCCAGLDQILNDTGEARDVLPSECNIVNAIGRPLVRSIESR